MSVIYERLDAERANKCISAGKENLDITIQEDVKT